MLLGLLRRRKKQGDEKRGAPRLEPGPQYQRVLIDGEELLVRRIIRITDDEIVYEDPYGNIRSVKRRGKKLLGIF